MGNALKDMERLKIDVFVYLFQIAVFYVLCWPGV